MKKITLILICLLPLLVLAQPNKNKVDSVQLVKDSLFQFINGQKQLRGIAGSVSGRDNIVFGRGAGNKITGGADNFYIGWEAGFNNTSGTGNVGILQDALYSNINGHENIAIGRWSQYKHTSPRLNTAVGHATFSWTTSGEENVGLGNYAGSFLRMGSGNVFLGAYAGETNQEESNAYDVSNAIAIGRYTGLSRMFSRTILIGYNIQPTREGEINIGNVYKGNVYTGIAEVNSIFISGRQITFDDYYMYVRTSNGIVKKVALQELGATTSQRRSSPVYGLDGRLLGYMIQ